MCVAQRETTLMKMTSGVQTVIKLVSLRSDSYSEGKTTVSEFLMFTVDK